MSNSTAPSYETGDIVILDKSLPFSQYKVGDAVLYTPPDFNEIVIHRIYDIQVINGTYYFAIKGDSNPQPDTVPQAGNVTNELLTNRTVTWSAFYGSNTTNPTAKYIVASYYPAKEVVHGKVIFRIPLLGWFFVPFNSPLPEPFHILPISMFSEFTLYYIILVIVTFFVIMNITNSELKKLINGLANAPLFHISPSHVKIKRYYAFIIYPLIIFAFIFFVATPVPLVDNNQIVLQSASQLHDGSVPYSHLVYVETKTISSFSVSQNNKTVITLDFMNQTNTMLVNITKAFHGTGQDLNTAEPYNITNFQSYQLTVDLNSMFVRASSIPNVPELGRFFDYAIPVQTSPPVGLMTQNVFLEAYNSVYNNVPSYTTHLNFSFIQDLISFQWNVKAHFDRNTGYLEYMQVVQTEQLWGIPEYIGMFIIAMASFLIYYLIRSKFQKMLDEKYAILVQSNIESAKQQDHNNNFTPGALFDKPYESTEKNDNSGSSQNENPAKGNNGIDSTKEDYKKKLSWEEYEKLENKK